MRGLTSLPFARVVTLPFARAPFAAFCAEEPRCHLRGLRSLPFARRSLAAIRASLQFSAVAMLPGVANACHLRGVRRHLRALAAICAGSFRCHLRRLLSLPFARRSLAAICAGSFRCRLRGEASRPYARVATSPALVCIVVNARTDLAAICAGRHAAICAGSFRCLLRGGASLPSARASCAAVCAEKPCGHTRVASVFCCCHAAWSRQCMPFARCPQAFAGTCCHLRGLLSLPFARRSLADICAGSFRCRLRGEASRAYARVATSPALVGIVVNARTDLAAICAGRHAAFCAEEPRCHLRGLLSLPFARRSLAAIRASLQFSAVAMLPGVANACHCAVSAGICEHSLPVLS